MDKLLVEKAQSLKTRYCDELELEPVFFKQIKSYTNINHTDQGYCVSDVVLGKIHLLDNQMQHLSTLSQSFSVPFDVVASGDQVFVSDVGDRAIYQIDLKTNKYQVLSEKNQFQKNYFLNFNQSARELFVSDQNCIWRWDGKKWDSLFRFSTKQIRYFNVHENHVFIYDGDSQSFETYDMKGNLAKKVSFRELSFFTNPYVGFQINPTDQSFFISQGKRVYRFSKDGELLFVVSLESQIEATHHIKRLFLISEEEKLWLYLILQREQKIFRVHFS